MKEEFQKPIVVSGSGLVASGAYYAAVAADQIVTNPGDVNGLYWCNYGNLLI